MCSFQWIVLLVIYSCEQLLNRLKSVELVRRVINVIVPLWPPIGVCPVPSVAPRLRVWGASGRIITLSVPPVPAWQRARCASRTTERRRSSCSADSVTGKLSSRSLALTCVCVCGYAWFSFSLEYARTLKQQDVFWRSRILLVFYIIATNVKAGLLHWFIMCVSARAGGYMPRVRVSTQRRTWRRLPTAALTAVCVKATHPSPLVSAVSAHRNTGLICHLSVLHSKMFFLWLCICVFIQYLDLRLNLLWS